MIAHYLLTNFEKHSQNRNGSTIFNTGFITRLIHRYYFCYFQIIRKYMPIFIETLLRYVNDLMSTQKFCFNTVAGTSSYPGQLYFKSRIFSVTSVSVIFGMKADITC